MSHRVGRRRIGRHRRTRQYGRVVVLVGSLLVTAMAAGAATGFLPYDGDSDPPAAAAAPALSDRADSSAGDSPDAGLPSTGPGSQSQPDPTRSAVAAPPEPGQPSRPPARSGHGRRVVYDISDQRVWLVRADGSVLRSYLVSGGITTTVQPGAYRVYSRSRHATAFDYQSTMDYMVRFTEGKTAPIGFHDIPENSAGDPVQTVKQLGTPRSHGCIRQRTADARAMWRFAGIDTLVRVLA